MLFHLMAGLSPALIVIVAVIVIAISMATVGDSASFKNLPDAVVFNDMEFSEAIPIWLRKDPAVVMAFGVPVGDGIGDGPFAGLPEFSRTEYVKGRKIEFESETQVDDMVGVSYTGAFAARSGQAKPTGYFSSEFDLARLRGEIDFDGRDLEQYSDAGKSQKINWIDTQYRRAENGRAQTLAKHLHEVDSSKTAPSDTRVGSIWHAVDNGAYNNSGSTDYRTYGTIDRSAAGNGDYQPARQVQTTGNLERHELGLCIDQVIVRGGNLAVGISNVGVKEIIREILEGFSEATVNGEFIEFGKNMFRYAGIDFTPSAYAPSNKLLLADPNGWRARKKMAPMVRNSNGGSPIVRDYATLDGWLMEFYFHGQVFCYRVNWQCKLEGINEQ